MAGDPVENILLESRDRLLIHKNPAAVEPATVYIQGEVGKPGRYPLTTNMRVADLVRVGGGLAPSADTHAADLVEFAWSGAVKLSGKEQEVALTSALAGDANSNLALHNGDVLTIRQLPGWNDLGRIRLQLKGRSCTRAPTASRPGERLELDP